VFFSQRSKPEAEIQAPTEEGVETSSESIQGQGDTIEADGNIHIESLDERSIEMVGNLIIGPTASFKGKVRAQGDARVDGTYEGSIETTGKLTIGPTADFRGALQAEDVVRIDGIYVGNIRADSRLIIGEQAKVLADVSAHDVSVAGAVKGDIVADNVEVRRTGRVWGDLTVHSFTLQDGGLVCSPFGLSPL